MSDFWQNTFLPHWHAWGFTLVITALKSVVLMSALLLVIAYLLLMDRKVWAAVQMRRGQIGRAHV